jgi:DNA-binding HxlR family transcriptional regulator
MPTDTTDATVPRDAGIVLGVLTDEPQVHWSAGELQRELEWPSERLQDALAELQRDGLAHRGEAFTWPTRAAVRCRELLA